MAFTNGQLAQQMSNLIGFWTNYISQYEDWLGGVVGGGPGLDGKYPLTDWAGNETLVACPAQLEEDVSGLVTSAGVSETNAAASAVTATTQAGIATTQAGLADTARIAAETAETNAETAETSSTNASVTSVAQANLATDRAGYAQEWANAAFETLVSSAAGGDQVDDYSALHWATVAEGFAGSIDSNLYGQLAQAETVTATWTWGSTAAVVSTQALATDGAGDVLVIGNSNTGGHQLRFRTVTDGTIRMVPYVTGTGYTFGSEAWYRPTEADWYFESGLSTPGAFRVYDATVVDYAELDHDGTDLNMTAGTTTDWNITGFNAIRFDNLVINPTAATVTVRDGDSFRVANPGNTDYADFSHNGTDFSLAFTNTTDWNVSGLAGNIKLTDCGLSITSTNSLLSIGNTTVTKSMNIHNDDTDNLFKTFGTGVNVRFGNYGTATGYVSVEDGYSLRIEDSSGTDAVTFSHDGTDFNTDFTNTAYWNINGDVDFTGDEVRYSGSLQQFNGTTRFSYDTTSSVTAALADGWVRIAKCTTSAGRGGCRIYVSHTGGSGAPDAMVIEIVASWDGKAAVSKILTNPGGTGITDVRVGYVSPEQYVNIKVSQASAQIYRIRVVQDLVLSGIWVADGVNPETTVFTDEYEFNVGTNNRYWGIHTADNVLGGAQFYLDSNGVTFESVSGDATLFLLADTSNTIESGNPNIVMRQDGTAVETVLGMSGLTAQDGRGNTVTDAINNTFLIHARWADSTNEIGFAITGQKYAAVTQDGLLVHDHVEPGTSTTATQGQTLLKGYYTGTENLFSIGSEYSSGRSCFMFGVQPKTGASGFTSMTDNNTNHGVLKMGTGGLYYQTKATSVVAIDADATLLTKLHVDDTGDLYIGGDAIGHFEKVAGGYGSVQVDGAEGSSGTYSGYSIGGRHVFMDNGGTTWGIYDDVSNEWRILSADNSYVAIRPTDTTNRLYVDQYGHRTIGGIYMSERANANTDLAGYGQLWTQNSAANVFFFTDDAGNDWCQAPIKSASQTGLRSIINVINTHPIKRQGFMVYDSTNNKPVWADGNTDGSVWKDATGATLHTPV